MKAHSHSLPGSAAYVIDHAAKRARRGKRPSMGFLGERNPRKALAIAKKLLAAGRQADRKNGLTTLLVEKQLAATGKTFRNLSDQELKQAVLAIIRTSANAEETRARLRAELGYPYRIDLQPMKMGDAISAEARDLAWALGGTAFKDGTPVLGMTHGHKGIIRL